MKEERKINENMKEELMNKKEFMNKKRKEEFY